MDDRRRHPRRPTRLALGIETVTRGDRAGLTHDVSASGLVFRSPSRFEVGEELTVRFRHPATGDESEEVTGTVVRSTTEAGRYLFRHRVALAFARPNRALERIAAGAGY